jgi:phenylacetate-CoA ligase
MEMIREAAELVRLLRNRRLSSDALRSLQDLKLRKLAAHVWERVPYYRSLFQSAGLSPGDIRTVDDLKKIPVTSKEDLRNAGLERTIAEGISPASCRTMCTNGSTGKPFTVYLTARELRTRQSIEFRTLFSVGFRPADRLSVLGPEHPHTARFHQRLGLFRSENISVLVPVEEQLRRLARMRPTLFWGYPTVLQALLHHADDRLGSEFHPRILITSGQGLDEVLKESLCSVWNDIGLFDFYGSVEFGRIAYECPAHKGLHINADHVILELAEDTVPAEAGENGNAVITALNAYAMPFIRYRLGDVVERIGTKCPCGSSFPLIGHVKGREDEMVQLPSGKLLSSFGLQCVLRHFNGIDQFRFIQRGPGSLTLQLAVRESFQRDCLQKMKAGFSEFLKEPVEVDIAIVPFVDGTMKYKNFVTLMPWDHHL